MQVLLMLINAVIRFDWITYNIAVNCYNEKQIDQKSIFPTQHD